MIFLISAGFAAVLFSMGSYISGTAFAGLAVWLLFVEILEEY